MDQEGSLSRFQLWIIGGLCCLVLVLGLSTIFSPKEAEEETQTVQTAATDQAVLDSTERAQPLRGKAEEASKPWWEWALERVIVDLDL